MFLNRLINQLNKLATATDQHRYKQITLKNKMYL